MVKLTFLLVVFLMIIVNITALKILTSDGSENSFNGHPKMIKILKQCFQNKLTTIIASFQSNKYVKNFLEELPDTSIILVNNYDSVHNQKWLFSGALIYVLETNSDKDLKATLDNLQLLPWWDRTSLFFLIGNSNNLCVNAKKNLNTMWTEKILSTIYVCHDHTGNIHKIFTFNPFTNRAPEPWKLSDDKSSGRWTLYEQTFQESEEMCLNLMFDKTKYLDGYEVKAVFTNNREIMIENSSLAAWAPIMHVPFGLLILDISKQLNISVSVEPDRTLIDDYSLGPLSELVSNKYDISLNKRPMLLSYPHKTRPFFKIPFSIFTERRPFLRPEEKISMYYFRSGTFSFIFVSIILLSAKILQGYRYQKFSIALLKIWESVFSLSLREPLNKFWARVYFFGVLMFFIVATESFKGNLAAFLTKPDRLQVDTVQDLIDLRYSVYVHEFFKYHPLDGFDKVPTKKLYYYNQHHCGQSINKDTACVAPNAKLMFFKLSQDKKLHISKKIMYDYVTWFTSPQFPLKQRLDTAISHYFQCGVVDHWHEKDWLRKIRKLSSVETEEVQAQFRPIEFDDLSFAFKFLIIGLSCSFVVFIMELSRR